MTPAGVVIALVILAVALLYLAYWETLQRIRGRKRRKILEKAFKEIASEMAKAVGVETLGLTRSHGHRVAMIATAIARAMRLPKSQVKMIERAALLHDTGKIGIPAHILTKPGPLTDEE